MQELFLVLLFLGLWLIFFLLDPFAEGSQGSRERVVWPVFVLALALVLLLAGLLLFARRLGFVAGCSWCCANRADQQRGGGEGVVFHGFSVVVAGGEGFRVDCPAPVVAAPVCMGLGCVLPGSAA